MRAAAQEARLCAMERDRTPRVIILGGGFGGLYCARALAGAPVRITVIDRRNHHVFQPLLYQVATAALSPGDVAYPIRAVLSRQKNASVCMAEATGLDFAARRVQLRDGLSPRPSRSRRARITGTTIRCRS